MRSGQQQLPGKALSGVANPRGFWARSALLSRYCSSRAETGSQAAYLSPISAASTSATACASSSAPDGTGIRT